MKAVFAILVLTAAMPAAAASPPDAGYLSTIAEYTPYRESPLADWRMANEAMGPMHGHMGHMMATPAKPVSGEETSSSPAQSGSMDVGSHHHIGGQP